MLMQQQAQAEAMMSQIKAQMESDLRMRNELLRSKLHMFNDSYPLNNLETLNQEQR